MLVGGGCFSYDAGSPREPSWDVEPGGDEEISGVSLRLGVPHGVGEETLEGKETPRRLQRLAGLGLQSRCEEEDSTASII